ncbi:MAG: MCE family protein [Alphaproteobacteria bacterium]|nr:MCE family protein [Alphaproteobacteria bacterium]
METRAEYVLVGSFVLILLAGLAVVLLWFVQAPFKVSATHYDIYFDGSVSGLDAGSDVRYNGVLVGRVAAITLDPQRPTQVHVTVDINQGLVIRNDAVAELQIKGLTGTAFVEITGVSGTAPPLVAEKGQRYPVIRSRSSQLTELFNGMPVLIQKLSTLADQLNEVTDSDNRAALAETLANMRRVSAVLAAHSRDLDATLGGLSVAVKHFDQAADNLDRMMRDSRKPVSDFTTRGLPELQQLLADSRVLVAELTRLVDSLDRDPSRVIYGNRLQGYTPQ